MASRGLLALQLFHSSFLFEEVANDGGRVAAVVSAILVRCKYREFGLSGFRRTSPKMIKGRLLLFYNDSLRPFL